MGCDVRGGPDTAGPFPHADDPVGVGAAGLACIQAPPVVSDVEFGRPAVATPPDGDGRRLGVPFHIDHRFLGDPPHLSFLHDRQAVGRVGIDVEPEVAPGRHPATELGDDVFEVLVLADVGPQVIEGLADLAESRRGRLRVAR